MKYFFTPLMMLSVLFINAQTQNVAVGIGTTTPSSNAILDVNSADKGLMLPRVNDTTNIANPSAGLFIYNKRTNSPNYYNGAQWRGVTDASNGNTGDSITYSIAGGTEFGTVIGLSQSNNFVITTSAGGGGSAGRTTVGQLEFSKLYDSNTIALRRAGVTQVHLSTVEFKYYKPGTVGPYYSIKLYDVMASTSNNQSNRTDGPFENYALYCSKIGYKDWINNSSFSFTVSSGTVGTY